MYEIPEKIWAFKTTDMGIIVSVFKVGDAIEYTRVPQEQSVDLDFILWVLKDAALMLERTPTKGGVTELGAENCRKAIAQIETVQSEQEPPTDVEKAISMYEAQAKQELDFCYQGGERDAIFVAKIMTEEYLKKRPRIKDNLDRLKIHLHKELGVTMQIERVVINTAVDAYFG